MSIEAPNGLCEKFRQGQLEVKNFSNFNFHYKTYIDGERIKIAQLIDKEIVIIEAKINNSRFINKRDSYASNEFKRKYAKIQLAFKERPEKIYMLNSSSRYIMEAIRYLIEKNVFPVATVIRYNKAGRYYYFN